MFELSRFLQAQESIYTRALAELKRGQKESHWMWFIFPQLAGLGRSSTASHYAIKGVDEAVAYMRHPVLSVRLIECCKTLLQLSGKSASEIFGFPDDLKLRSCVTLFSRIEGANPVFQAVLDKYFDGEPDPKTLELLGGR